MNVHTRFHAEPTTAHERAAAYGTKPINFALQGGGAHGAFGWGVLDRLLEDGRLEVDGFSATSAGAMNAVVYAYGHMIGGKEKARETLETFWKRISDAGALYSPIKRTPFERIWGFNDSMSYRVFEAMTHTFSPYEFNPANFNPLRKVLSETVDFEQIHLCECTRLSICATNVRTGKARVFSNKEVTLDVVMASACLPMLFQAVEIEGEAYWDGGYAGNPAIYPLIYNTDTSDVMIVHINPINRKHVPKRAAEIYNRINEISFNSSLLREMRAIAFATRLIDDDWIKPEYRDRLKRLNIHAIRSDDVMADFTIASKFETDWKFLTRLRDLGREAASMWLSANFDKVGRTSSVDIRHDYLEGRRS
jgi:NTE family protein